MLKQRGSSPSREASKSYHGGEADRLFQAGDGRVGVPKGLQEAGSSGEGDEGVGNSSNGNGSGGDDDGSGDGGGGGDNEGVEKTKVDVS